MEKVYSYKGGIYNILTTNHIHEHNLEHNRLNS